MEKINANHREFSPSEEQRANLTRLADFLESGEIEYTFDMSVYYSHRTQVEETWRWTFKRHAEVYDCNTVACAVGSGPAIGLQVLESEKATFKVNWRLYSNRVFGTGADTNVRAHDFMFSGNWFSVDNSPEGAAKRIRYALEHGVPSVSRYAWRNMGLA